MKKIKLISALAVVLPLALTTTTIVTGCSSNKTIYEQIKDATLNEFYQICKIPHPSDALLFEVPYKSNCLKLSDYLKSRVEQLTGAKVWQDKYANLWFDLPANDESLKDAPILALGAHMDMVFSYDSTKFTTAPDPLTTVIEPVIETIDGKQVLHTKDYKTSLGADDGIGIATILALISNKNVKHGKLRIMFSNCEENGAQGAMLAVKGREDDTGQLIIHPSIPEVFDGVKNFLSLDGECDGAVTISTSGAVGSHYSKTHTPITPTLTNKFILKLSGFKGGHSADCARGQLGNPITVASEILKELGTDNVEIASLATIDSLVYNAVATGYNVTFATNKTKAEVESAIKKIKDSHMVESSEKYYKDIKDASITVESATFDKVLSKDNSNKIITLQNTLLYGKEETPEEEKLFIKTSACIGPSNLSLNNQNKLFYKCSSYSRSDKEDRVRQFKTENKAAADAGGFDYLNDALLIPWKEEVGNRMYNLVEKALIDAGIPKSEHYVGRWHGGSEVAWWKWSMLNNSKITDGNICELGANIIDEHKYTESVEIDSIITNIKATIYCLAHANDLK